MNIQRGATNSQATKCSQDEVDNAVVEVLETIEMRQKLLRGQANYAAGNYIVGVDAARKEAGKRRK